MTATKSTSQAPWLIYLRVSDLRGDTDSFPAREAKLRAECARLALPAGRTVIENDVSGKANGRARPASAFKRVAVRDRAGNIVRDENGRPVKRVFRPGWQGIVADLAAGRAGGVMCEDLDRAARDPRDLEDLIDAVAIHRTSARSLSGSLTLTAGGTTDEITMARWMVAAAWKASKDTARRVTDGRERQAAAGSYGGGRRPWGFAPDPDAPKYGKTLVQVPAEAAEVRRAGDRVLAGWSLKAIVRDLRERSITTVKHGGWTAEALRDALVKPATAGLVPAGGTLVRATWEPIIERERWEQIRAALSERGQRFGSASTGNEPKHVLSGIARCGICGAPVKAGGGSAGRSYVCTAHAHLRRASAATDAYVLAFVAEYLNRDGAEILRPPARPGVDTAALRAESHRLSVAGERQAAMHAMGEISDGEMRAGSRARKARLDAIAGQLAAEAGVDQLAELRGVPDAGAVLASLPLPRVRAIVALLVSVTLMPATRRGPAFDPASVIVAPAAEAQAA